MNTKKLIVTGVMVLSLGTNLQASTNQYDARLTQNVWVNIKSIQFWQEEYEKAVQKLIDAMNNTNKAYGLEEITELPKSRYQLKTNKWVDIQTEKYLTGENK